MPIVTIETWPMPQERKPELMNKITKVFTEWGIPAQAVTILTNANLRRQSTQPVGIAKNEATIAKSTFHKRIVNGRKVLQRFLQFQKLWAGQIPSWIWPAAEYV